MRSPAPAESGTARSLERGLLTNALGILVKASRTLYVILFGHVLGAAGFGTYLLAFAVQEAVSKFAILGLNWGGKQLVGRLIADGHGDSVRPTVIRILWITLAFSGLVAAALFLCAGWILALLQQPSLIAPLRIFACGFPFLCGMYVLVYSFRPRLDMKYELYVTSIIEPVGVLVIGAALLLRAPSVEMLARAHVAASVIAFLAALYFFDRIYPAAEGRGPPRIDWDILLHGSAAMGGMELVGNLQSRLDLFFLARYFPPHVIGVYGAASQIVSLLRKAKAAFDPILMPIAQGLFLRSNRERLQGEVTRAVGWAVYVGLGLLGLMVLLPDELLGLFGSDFSGAGFGSVLIILAVGQFFYMSLGLSEGVLAITGHAYITLVSALVLVGIEIVLLPLLIPLMGLEGAALAASIPFVVVTLWRMLQTRRLLDVDLITRMHVRVAVVWLVCLGAALMIAAVSGDVSRMGAVVAAILFLVTYKSIGWRVGIERTGR